MRLSTTTTVALVAASLTMMLDRIFSFLVPARAPVRTGCSKSQVLRKASRGQSVPSLGSLRMGGGLAGLGTTKNVPVMDTFRPRPLLRRCINDAPREPGVYIMESAEGNKLYIGKSINLSSRVPSYFGSSGSDRGGAESAAARNTAVVLLGGNLSRRIGVMTTLVDR